MAEKRIPVAKLRKAVEAYAGGAKLASVASGLGVGTGEAERLLWKWEPVLLEGVKVRPKGSAEFDLSDARGRRVAAEVVYALREGNAVPSGVDGTGRVSGENVYLRYERIASRTGIALG